MFVKILSGGVGTYAAVVGGDEDSTAAMQNAGKDTALVSAIQVQHLPLSLLLNQRANVLSERSNTDTHASC